MLAVSAHLMDSPPSLTMRCPADARDTSPNDVSSFPVAAKRGAPARGQGVGSGADAVTALDTARARQAQLTLAGSMSTIPFSYRVFERWPAAAVAMAMVPGPTGNFIGSERRCSVIAEPTITHSGFCKGRTGLGCAVAGMKRLLVNAGKQ